MSSFLLALAFAAQNATPAQTAPGWTFRESDDPAKPKSASAAVRSADGNARMIVRCDTADHPIVSVQFLPRPPLAAGPARTVQVTLDNGLADISSWQFPGMGAYNGEPVEVFMLVEEIAKAKVLDIATDDGSGATVGGHFTGPGGDGLFRQVYAACGLPYAMPSATPVKS